MQYADQQLDLDMQGILHIQAAVLATECTAILGKRKSGKSNTVARFLEQILAHGGNASLIDAHNEHGGLRERYPVLIAGGSGADIAIQPQHGKALAEWVYNTNASIILAIRDFNKQDTDRFLTDYVTTLTRLFMSALVRRPHLIVVEEAHNFLPQNGGGALKDALKKVATDGRKFGLGMIITDQRFAAIDKTVLMQADVMVLHRVSGVTDLDTYQRIADLPNVREIAAHLKIGEAIVMLGYDLDFKPQVVQIKARETTHGGNTPLLGAGAGAVSSQELSGLRDLLARFSEDEESDHVKQMRRLNATIDAQQIELARLREENRALREQVDTLAVIKVRVERDLQPPQRPEIDPLQVGVIHIAQANATPVVPLLPVITTRALDKQKREFEQMIKSIGLYPKVARVVTGFLLDYEGHSYTLKELARYSGYSLTTLRNIQPLAAIQEHLIRRTGQRTGTTRLLRWRAPHFKRASLIWTAMCFYSA